ncbi:MAG TPA: metallophosphoesterase [Kofleriaceae bacterium]|nr:metallophosphoesterase [Kofleriaceae bacterium]
MRTIAHISDLHFGTQDPAVAAALLAELDGTTRPKPSLIAVSGDLTQRAREEEYRAARAWLARLPVPAVVVPGNHDVPLYDVASRLLRPMARWRDAMGDELMPCVADEEIAVVGINTAHGLTVKGGRITHATARAARDRLASLRASWKVLVAHHPFALPAGGDRADVARGADEALPILEDVGLDLILTGHLHIAYTSDPIAFRSSDHAIVAAHAGTCMSRRLRGEPNGYNVITLVGDQLTITNRVWDGERFADGRERTYLRGAGGVKIKQHERNEESGWAAAR